VHKRVDRRSFLASTAYVGGAAVVASLPRRSVAASADPYDLIVIGGGNAGMPAAIFAGKRGARVLVIEAAGQLGGTLHLSSGQMSAAGTKLQKSKGIVDTPQSHYDDIMRISKHTANPTIVRLAVENNGATFDWLTDNGFTVLPGHPEKGTTHEPYSVARYAWGPEGGRSILKVLNAQLQPLIDSGKVQVLLNTKAKSLIQGEKGAVVGVVAEGPDKKPVRYLGSNILLTSGGFASNPVMFKRIDLLNDYNDSSYPFSQGEGITLGESVGGYVRGGELHAPLFGGIMTDDDYPSPMLQAFRPWPPSRPPWEIFVNVYGKRFLQEDVASHDVYEESLKKQPNTVCWVVFDEPIMNAAPQILSSQRWSRDQYKAMFNKRKFFHRADSLEELAKLAGVDPAGLVQAVADYNRGQASGHDALGRKHMPLPIKQAPFYAIKLHSWKFMGFGGLAVDGKLRVVRRDGTPVPNLYAAGEVLGSAATMGNSHCGGMCVTPALTFGRLLGDRMLKFGASAKSA
jgi:fumarate reductase flavoprotein subunit